MSIVTRQYWKSVCKLPVIGLPCRILKSKITTCIHWEYCKLQYTTGNDKEDHTDNWPFAIPKGFFSCIMEKTCKAWQFWKQTCQNITKLVWLQPGQFDSKSTAWNITKCSTLHSIKFQNLYETTVRFRGFHLHCFP